MIDINSTASTLVFVVLGACCHRACLAQLVVDDPGLRDFEIAQAPSPNGICIGPDDDVFVAIGLGILRIDYATWNDTVFTAYPFTGTVWQMDFDEGMLFGEPVFIASDVIGNCHPPDDYHRVFNLAGDVIAEWSNTDCSTSIVAVGEGPIWDSKVLWGKAGSGRGIRARDLSGQSTVVVSLPWGLMNGAADAAVIVPPDSTFALDERHTLVFTDSFQAPHVGIQRVNDLGAADVMAGDISTVGQTGGGIDYDPETDSILVLREWRDLLRVSADGTYTILAHVEDPEAIRGLARGNDDRLYVSLLEDESIHVLIPAGSLGDLNRDGLIQFADLLILLGEWGPCETPCPEDLDGNGSVGFSDVLILIGNWS